jgi:RNA polymerase sigma factor (TIGR02999 family)
VIKLATTSVGVEASGPVAAKEVLPRVYDELRRLAAREMARGAAGHTLQATALVHEAWLKLGGSDRQWENRAHFFGAAAQAMRQILVDRARRKATARHGGGRERVELTESKIVEATPDEQVLAIHEALDRLAEHDATKAEVVKLRYFGGLTLEEAAEVLGISHPTAKRYWAYARAWLLAALDDADGASAR